LIINMQQETQGGWRYEWPLRRRARWPIQQLLDRRQQQVLRMWLRKVENLSDEEEKISVRDLMRCQEGRSENSNF
jgi:hypothetical protein